MQQHLQRWQRELMTTRSESEYQALQLLLTKLDKRVLDPLGGILSSVSYCCGGSCSSRNFPSGVSLVWKPNNPTVRKGAWKSANSPDVSAGLCPGQFG